LNILRAFLPHQRGTYALINGRLPCRFDGPADAANDLRRGDLIELDLCICARIGSLAHEWHGEWKPDGSPGVEPSAVGSAGAGEVVAGHLDEVTWRSRELGMPTGYS
jgi:hypothetical protein